MATCARIVSVADDGALVQTLIMISKPAWSPFKGGTRAESYFDLNLFLIIIFIAV